MKKFVLIDGNALIHRSYHALPKTLRTPSGELTNAVHGFTGILLGILEVEKPTYIATAWDMKGPTFRDAMLQNYKGTRKKTDDELIQQFPRTYEVLDAMSIPIYKRPGLEADDFLGIVSRILEEDGDVHIVVVTSDQDALQLVSERVEVVAPISGYRKVKRYDRAAVKEKMGVWPEQVADFKGIAGDSSDNIKGVPGIGKKGAQKLIEAFGSVEGIYERIEEVEPLRIRGLLKEHEEDARTCKAVATIVREDGDIRFDREACAVHDFDMVEVQRIFETLAFKSHMRRVYALDKEWEKRRMEEQQVSLF